MCWKSLRLTALVYPLYLRLLKRAHWSASCDSPSAFRQRERSLRTGGPSPGDGLAGPWWPLSLAEGPYSLPAFTRVGPSCPASSETEPCPRGGAFPAEGSFCYHRGQGTEGPFLGARPTRSRPLSQPLPALRQGMTREHGPSPGSFLINIQVKGTTLSF